MAIEGHSMSLKIHWLREYISHYTGRAVAAALLYDVKMTSKVNGKTEILTPVCETPKILKPKLY